jgi:CSLREA domain-containing protein
MRCQEHSRKILQVSVRALLVAAAGLTLILAAQGSITTRSALARPTDILVLDPSIVNALTLAACAPSCDLTVPSDLLAVADADGDGDGVVEPTDFATLDVDPNELDENDGALWIIAFVTNDTNVWFSADEGIFASTGNSTVNCMVDIGDEDCNEDGTEGDDVVVDELLGNGVADRGNWVLDVSQEGVDVMVDYWVVGDAIPVDSTGDAPDSNLGDGVCDDGTGACTLRAAIQQANQTLGADTITFQIGTGVQTITPLSALPSIDDPVTIDGTTQPGFAGSPIIELNGTSADAEGLTLAASGNTVQGLVINRFAGAGVYITGNANVVRGNFIGTDVSGSVALGNGGNAVSVFDGADNTIGGTAPGERNVMSGNSGNGILILGGSATGNVVEGNFIGTDATGTLDLGNSFAGVGVLNSASHNTIGGTAPGAGNIVSGNRTVGVGVGAGGVCRDNVIQGNRIGTDITGTLPIGNGVMGVGVGGENNIVGGSTSEAGNIIAFNGGSGVDVDTVFAGGTGDAIRGNSIFSNSGLGIDLEPEGVTANDAGDADTGANNLQNFPILTSAVSGSTTVQGTLNSTPSTQFTLEFFQNSSCDPSGYGEGESLLGSAIVGTDADGNASFSVEFPDNVAPGRFITATATDPAGNTSEFSKCIAATSAAPSCVLDIQKEDEPDSVAEGGRITYTITANTDDAIGDCGGITITDTIPRDTDCISTAVLNAPSGVDFDVGGCDNRGDVVWTTTGGVGTDEDVVVRMVVRLEGDAEAGDTIRNEACVTAEGAVTVCDRESTRVGEAPTALPTTTPTSRTVPVTPIIVPTLPPPPPPPTATPVSAVAPIIAPPSTGEGPSAGPGWGPVIIVAGGIGTAVVRLALLLRRRRSG